MKQFDKLRYALKGLTDATSRFPLTAIFLIIAVVINAVDISTEGNYYTKYLLTLVVGAFLGAVGQVMYERYFYKTTTRILLIGITILLTGGYYLIIMPVPRLSIEIAVRTAVTLFALLIAFIWTPVIKSIIGFNESFMVTFKAFFISLFFSGVLFAGVSIIFATINELLFTVDYKIYAHTGNIVFILFAPIFFLSLIPVYLGERDKNKNQESIRLQMEAINKLTNCPKYLEILISYIIIPLTAVFTIILLLYIILNFGEGFWTNNMLEPMIVAYSIIVILVYILASKLENKFASLFRLIFPKMLIPIVLFQTLSSAIKIGDMGITYPRYYVILYCIFATAAGIIFSILPVRKNGIIAAMLIGFSVLSIVPPVDAFNVSKYNQINLLQNILIKNNMLELNQIKPSASLVEEEKLKIIKVVNYLSMMEYTNEIPWLPSDFNMYEDFYQTFGFYQYEQVEEGKQVYLNLPQNSPIDVAGYDFFVYTNILLSGQNDVNEEISDTEKEGIKYTLTKKVIKDQGDIVLTDENKQEIIVFSMKEIFNRFENYDTNKSMISVEDATFSKENDLAIIKVIVQNLNMNIMSGQDYYGADIYVLVKIK